MKRILLMVLRNIVFVPYWWIKLCWYAPSEISDKISQQAAKDYQKFMTTKTYTDYTKAYEVFLKKNPGYEDKIAGKLNG